MLESELARLRAGGAMEALDMTRVMLDPPPLEKRNDYGAWKRALDNAHSQLEHQYNRCADWAAPSTASSNGACACWSRRVSGMGGGEYAAGVGESPVLMHPGGVSRAVCRPVLAV